MSARGQRCKVLGCSAVATHDLPLDSDCDEYLDVGVCRPHHDEIAAGPSAWRITSKTVRNSKQEILVVERV